MAPILIALIAGLIIGLLIGYRVGRWDSFRALGSVERRNRINAVKNSRRD